MLTITVGADEVFDDATQEFGSQGGFELQLEHSLVSLSKWESIHEKPFLDTQEKTQEETISYIKCMVLSPNPPGDFLLRLSKENFEEINNYISRKMTATWFSEVQPQSRNSEIVTSELIYYWMTAFQIPFECENWHLNRLFTLIRICNIKQEKPKDMTRAELARRNRELNAQRKKMLGTKG
jgi:hypothetical protein